jgi:hypothetical protein
MQIGNNRGEVVGAINGGFTEIGPYPRTAR